MLRIRFWLLTFALLGAGLACGYGGPVQDDGSPGNNADGSGTWFEADDGTEADTGRERELSSVAVAPGERFIYALYDSGVSALDTETGLSTQIVTSTDIIAWGVFFGTEHTLIVGIQRGEAGLQSRVWQATGADVLASATFDLDLRGGRVSPTGEYLCVSDNSGTDVIATEGLTHRRLETDSEALLASQSWVPGGNTLLRFSVPDGDESTLPALSMQSWNVASGVGGPRVTVSEDATPSWAWASPSVRPDGGMVAVPFVTADGVPETAFVDLTSGSVAASLRGVGDPLEYLPNGSGILTWDDADQSLVAVYSDLDTTVFSLNSADVPAWIILEDSVTVLASVESDEDATIEIHLLHLPDGQHLIVSNAAELHDIAVRGTDVFLAAEDSEAAGSGLYLVDTLAGEMTWTGFDASTVSYLPTMDALLIDDPGDSGLYRLVDAGTLRLIAWYQL